MRDVKSAASGNFCKTKPIKIPHQKAVLDLSIGPYREVPFRQLVPAAIFVLAFVSTADHFHIEKSTIISK
jgi:hypothetical protein